jgi:glycosyltransferase involved in cell wall biosynthesis
MTTLRVILDQMIAPVPGGVGRYAEELTRQLIATAPRGSHVAGFVSASPEGDYAAIHDALPGLTTLHKSALDRRQLSLAWQHGFTSIPGEGLIHATSVLAPLSRHDRHTAPSGQIAVTIHDAVPWTHPETLTPRGASWHRAMAKRAARYADAIVVPTHAVAGELTEILDLGDRVRVIGGAVASTLRLPDDPAEVAARLALPDRYLLAVGTLEPRKGLDSLVRALALGLPEDVPLLVIGQGGWGDVDLPAVVAEAGLAADRVRALGSVSDTDLAVALDRATVFVFPSRAEGFGLPVLEALSFGTPVVHSDVPAVVEVTSGAGLEIPLDDPDGFPQRLADGIRSVLEDSALAERLSISGRDRAKAFSWRDSAEKVWQLHADL